MCFFSPIRDDPQNHINKLLPPTQSLDNPQMFFYVYVFFLSLTHFVGHNCTRKYQWGAGGGVVFTLSIKVVGGNLDNPCPLN